MVLYAMLDKVGQMFMLKSTVSVNLCQFRQIYK